MSGWRTTPLGSCGERIFLEAGPGLTAIGTRQVSRSSPIDTHQDHRGRTDRGVLYREGACSSPVAPRDLPDSDHPWCSWTQRRECQLCSHKEGYSASPSAGRYSILFDHAGSLWIG